MYNKLIILVILTGILFGLENIYPYFKGRTHRIKHALPNIVIAGINGIITSVFFAGLTLAVIRLAEDNSFGFLHLIHMPSYIELIIGFILFDLWMYLWHRLIHRNIFLWRFHRMHHSDPEMDNTTALRFHPGEIALSSLIRLIIIPILGMNFIQLLVYEIMLQPVILFHHSNIGLSEKWDRLLRSIIVTPNMHRVHHSREGIEFSSNYSSIFSFWDRLFGSFRKIDNTLTIKFGLKILREPKWQSLQGMLLTPINKT